jgi:hypothetical protein
MRAIVFGCAVVILALLGGCATSRELSAEPAVQVLDRAVASGCVLGKVVYRAAGIAIECQDAAID